jgi:hypothetical protein
MMATVRHVTGLRKFQAALFLMGTECPYESVHMTSLAHK